MYPYRTGHHTKGHTGKGTEYIASDTQFKTEIMNDTSGVSKGGFSLVGKFSCFKQEKNTN
jgi:hypothetical protein